MKLTASFMDGMERRSEKTVREECMFIRSFFRWMDCLVTRKEWGQSC